MLLEALEFQKIAPRHTTEEERSALNEPSDHCDDEVA